MSNNKIIKTIKFSGFDIARNWLYGEPSRTIDRFAYNVQEIYLPCSETREGELEISLDLDNLDTSVLERSIKSKAKEFLLSGYQSIIDLDDSHIVVDLRRQWPENWAHAFTNHLPVALLIRENLSEINKNITIVLPEKISKNINNIYEFAGFSVVNTNAQVRGYICNYKVTPWISIRGDRCDIVTRTLDGSEFQRLIRETESTDKKLFISRKDRRKLINEQEFVEYLTSFGYKALYLEDFLVMEQISLLVNAEKIIAVHGAGLGPLILRGLNGSMPYRLLEIFSPAHVTNVYRTIAQQNGGEWAGVRGNIWAELLNNNANFEDNLKDFSASLESLKVAMSRLGM